MNGNEEKITDKTEKMVEGPSETGHGNKWTLTLNLRYV